MACKHSLSLLYTCITSSYVHFPDERAIERAEDSGARERYTTALKTAKATSERNERAYANMSGKNSVMQQFERTAVHKLSVASNRGLRIDPGGSLALLGFAYNQGQKGFLMLDEYVDKVNGQNVGQAGTNTNQELSGKFCSLYLCFLLKSPHTSYHPL
jgi:hypothetical protein